MSNYDKLFDELYKLSEELNEYYTVDKVMNYSVCVWGYPDNSEDLTNVFDIEEDGVSFHSEHTIIPEAVPTINKIQSKLKDISNELDGGL